MLKKFIIANLLLSITFRQILENTPFMFDCVISVFRERTHLSIIDRTIFRFDLLRVSRNTDCFISAIGLQNGYVGKSVNHKQKQPPNE